MAQNRPPGMDCTYESLRQSPDVLEKVEDRLLAEQGGICAYTGHRISIQPAIAGAGGERQVEFHIEHLIPQAHCAYGQDADYANIVACWPRPNCRFEPEYGARKKGDWPAPEEAASFVSPLRADCNERFRFNHRGEIEAANHDDQAVELTIERLGLKHKTLTSLRQQAIRGALAPNDRRIKLTTAKKLLSEMRESVEAVDGGAPVKLRAFCFAIEPALRREISKLEGIMKVHGRK